MKTIMSMSNGTNGNGCLEHIYERSQKLTEALYRVTDLFSDSEPLKWLLRRDGLEIFESLLKVKTASTNERVRGLSQTAEKVRQLVRVFELAASGSFISDANFQVLKREYLSLAGYLAERKHEILPELPAEGLIGQIAIGQLPSEVNGHKSGKSLALTEAPSPLENSVSDSNVKDVQSGSTNEIKGVNGENGINVDRAVNGGERRSEIISLIKEKDWTSVGELAETFKGRISEKTLQRDLVGMASEGLLLKEGEKRWRRYKLAQEVKG